MKSKSPKVTKEKRAELAALRPGMESLREAYRQPPIPYTAELEATAGRRVAAWDEAWAQTPELVRARFLWLEDRCNELLREVAEQRPLQDREAQAQDKRDANPNKGGRPEMASDAEIAAALDQARRNLGKPHSMQRLDLEAAAILNAERLRSGCGLISPESVKRRRLELRSSAKPEVSAHAKTKPAGT